MLEGPIPATERLLKRAGLSMDEILQKLRAPGPVPPVLVAGTSGVTPTKLIVQGTGFNWHSPDHLRVVFLPNSDDLTDAIGRIATFLEHYRSRHARQAA